MSKQRKNTVFQGTEAKDANTTKNNTVDEMKEEKTMKSAKTAKTVKPLTNPIEGSHPNEKYMWLNNSQLRISPDIQRKLDPARVAEIVENYDPLVANPIKVSYRDGFYYIIDGMHTREASVVIHGTDDFPIFCRVYYGLTKEDEARLFALQFGISEPVPMPYRLRALDVAKDPEVRNFLKITKRSGFTITLGNRITANGRIAAVCGAFKAYRYLGADDYGRMLKMINRTWAGESWSVTKNMLGGMARFMKMYDVSPRDFMKAFREVTYKEIIIEANRFEGMSKDGAYGAALAEIYDRRSPEPLKEAA